MRFFLRTIPLKELILHTAIILLVIISYSYLLFAAYILPIPTYSSELKNVFGHLVAPWPIFPGLGNIRFCYYGDKGTGFVSQAERGTMCQINFDEFSGICRLFGLLMSDAELRIFFNTLDITGNEMLSWGELGLKMFKNDTTVQLDSVFIYYANRWKHMRSFQIGGGLERLEGFDYEPYRIDYSTYIWDRLGIWGPRGEYDDFENHKYTMNPNITTYW
jgi:hypothetical protein